MDAPLRSTDARARQAELDDEALALLRPGMGSKAFLERLAEGGRHLQAIRFLAHRLPPRSAVWWGWGCAVQAAGDPVHPRVQDCIDTTRAWIAEPSDTRRYAAGAAAEAVPDSSPASLAALAAFMSGGSLAPPGLPEVPAPPLAAARLATGAVSLAAGWPGDPDTMQKRLELYLKQGLEVMRKSGGWPEESAYQP